MELIKSNNHLFKKATIAMALALYPYYDHKIEKRDNVLVVTKGREVRKQLVVLDKNKRQ